jgi:hypothetical protein
MKEMLNIHMLEPSAPGRLFFRSGMRKPLSHTVFLGYPNTVQHAFSEVRP